MPADCVDFGLSFDSIFGFLISFLGRAGGISSVSLEVVRVGGEGAGFEFGFLSPTLVVRTAGADITDL